MAGRDVVPFPLGGEVGEDGSVEPAHPVERVGSTNAVRDVLVRLVRRLGRRVGRGHVRHRTLAGLGVALAFLAAALTPLPGQPASASEDEPVVFTVALGGDVETWNPFLGTVAESYEMWALFYDFMIAYKMEDMSPAPSLATEWETSEDGLTWTFDIRDDVDWSDGEHLTAADIAFTYNLVLGGGAAANNYSSYLNNVDAVTAPDDTTVVLTLSEPNASLPLLPIPIVPEHIWKDVSKEEMKTFQPEPTPEQPLVGTGPFIPVSGTPGGSEFRFVANENYWGDGPYVDEVEFRIFRSNDPAVQALIKGEVDFVEDITPLQVRALQDEDGITAQNGISPYFNEIGFNTGAVDTETGEPIGDGNPALQDPAFRYALGYAVDTERIVEGAFQGAAEPGSTVIAPFYPIWQWQVPEELDFEFDLEKAGELLDEAGYTLGDDGKRTMPDGSPVGTLRLFARSDSESSVDTLDFFASWLGEIGIDSEVTVMDSNTLYERQLEGTYDVFEWGWYIEPDPGGILADFTCEQRGGLSDSWYCDEEYDAMYAAQSTELDQDARVEIVHQMQEQLYREAPYIVTAYDATGEAVRNDRFACFQPQPDPGGVWLVQYGGRNYSLLRPADEAGDCDGITSALGASETSGTGGGGNRTVTFLVGGAVLLLVVVGGGVWMMRRRATAAERE
jgi:peptide/nickel transport system substrate-binding protein